MLAVLLAYCELSAMAVTAAAPDLVPPQRPAATWVTTNPLRGLGELPKVHNMWEGIDPSYLDPPPGRNTTRAASLALMVDFARIMGSFPAIADAAGTFDTAVEICINASRLHSQGRLPYLALDGSPWEGG